MALTLDQARTKLYKYVVPTLNVAVVTEKINSALERIYNSGKWKGMLTEVVFNNFTDANEWWRPLAVPYITLPRKFQSVLGVRYNSIPKLIYPRWQEFMASGAGKVSAGAGLQMLIDEGDDFPTYNDPTAPYWPRIEITDAQDVGKVVKIYAVDQYGADIFDSQGNKFLAVTLTQAGVTMPNYVAKIVAIHKPITEGKVNLYAVNPYDTTKACQIGSYDPTETIPTYKRYKASGSQFAAQLTCLCKRRFVPLVAGPDDEQVIVPNNEGALKLVLMALQYEDKNDMERAETYFQKAIQLLNSELKEDLGNPVITLQMNPVAAAMRIPIRY
jgi:hypothetical protein